MKKFPNQTVERLTALRGILNMHERAAKRRKPCKLNGVSRKFNLHSWDCGTAACAIGSAALHPWFKERGLHIDWNEPVYKDSAGWLATTIFFGITSDEAYNAFGQWSYTKKATPAMVRERVDALIAKYSKKEKREP